jgi:hypothetical protein
MSKAKNPNRKNGGADYEIGYGKPPVKSRFKPGQSGNQKGRPKGVRNFATDVKATLAAPVKVTRDGRPRKVSTQQAMLLRAREKALGGDARSLDKMFQLAQTYNNEDLSAAAASLAADDAVVLEVFKARVLGGIATGSSELAKGPGASEGDSTPRPIDSDAGVVKPGRVSPNSDQRVDEESEPETGEGDGS